MLSNTLTLDDEDAVQAELASLQRELVSLSSLSWVIIITSAQMPEPEPESIPRLPSVPQQDPIEQVPVEGEYLPV
jgi:hypothetical protein